MKVHFVNENGKTLCGKNLKPTGLLDPIEELTKESFFSYSEKGMRCQICEKLLIKPQPNE